MTSTTVTETNQYFMNVTGNVNAKKNQSDAFMDCFSQAYGGQNHSNEQSVKAPQKNDALQTKVEYHKDKLQGNKPDHTDKITTDSETDAKPATDIKPVEKPAEKSDTAENVEDAAEEVMEAVAAQLGVSVEAVREMMLQNGMSAADMLNPEQVTQLMLNLAGSESSLELLTNAELYADVEQVLQKVEDVLGALADELQVEPQQLQNMLESAYEQTQNVETLPQAETFEEAENPKMQKDSMAEAVQTGEKANETRMQEEPVITVDNEKPLETAVKQTTDNASNGGKNQSGEDSQKGKSETGQANLEYLNAQVGAKVDMSTMVEELTAEIHQAPDTEHIMRQIMDYMKVQVKADMTQMEIQLHPSSLGNVNVQISSREGVITAQFTAQNENVKAALEAQIVQLKETLTEQGVKVEAVEVTIASHSFERNLQQNNGQNAEDAQQDKEKKRGSKRLNLNLGAGEELDGTNMEDADKIAVDMMVRNGNTVDFSA